MGVPQVAAAGSKASSKASSSSKPAARAAPPSALVRDAPEVHVNAPGAGDLADIPHLELWDAVPALQQEGRRASACRIVAEEAVKGALQLFNAEGLGRGHLESLMEQLESLVNCKLRREGHTELMFEEVLLKPRHKLVLVERLGRGVLQICVAVALLQDDGVRALRDEVRHIDIE